MTEETGRSLFPERSIYEHQLERPQFFRASAAGRVPSGSGLHGPKRSTRPSAAPLSRTLINLAVTLIFAAVYFYVVLPPINLQAEEFYFFMLLCCAVYCGCAVLTSGFQGSGAKGYFGFVKKQCRIPMIIAVALVAVAIVGGIVGWQVIRAGAYRDLLTVETGDFATEVEEISYDQIPMLDKDSAEKLGNRKLGELSDMVSQFEVAEEYTQIKLQGPPGAGDAPAVRGLDQVVQQPLPGLCPPISSSTW